MYHETTHQIYATDDPMWITSHQAFLQLTIADPLYLDYRRNLDPLWNGLRYQASEAIESANYDALPQVLEHLGHWIAKGRKRAVRCFTLV